MGVMVVNYKNIREYFVAAFPELQVAYARLAADYVMGFDGQPGTYFLIESLFAVYIEVLLAMPSTPLRDAALHKSFGFIEEMLAAEDDEVEGLAQIGMIEGRNQWWFQRVLPFVGPLWHLHANQMSMSTWKAALAAGATAPPALNRDISDLFGVREAIVLQLAPEGISLSDIPGTTHL